MTPIPLSRIRLDQTSFDIFAEVFAALNPPAIRAELQGLDLDAFEIDAQNLGNDIRPRLDSSLPITRQRQIQVNRDLGSPNRTQALSAAWKLLRAVDWACEGFGLLSGRVRMSGQLIERLEWDGKLNLSTSGLVLPKGCSTTGSNHILLENLHNLTWVPVDPQGYAVDYNYLPRHLTRPGKTVGEHCSIGFIRVAKDMDDLNVESRSTGTSNWYSVSPNPARRTVLAARIEAGINILARRKADIIVMPESVMDEQLFELVLRVSRGLPDGLNPIVIAGTRLLRNGAERSRSRCTTVTMRGRITWQQDKLHPYNIASGTINDWGLAGKIVPGSDGLAKEDIAPEFARVAVRDTSIGRILVLICQDLSDGGELNRLVEHLSPTHLIVPVLDSTAGAFWQRAGAAFRSSFVGGTFVCNSHCIYANQVAAGITVSPPTPPPFAFYNVRLPLSERRHGTNEREAQDDIFLF